MDISFISDYAVPVIVGICICIGYIIKNLIKTDKVNQYIPLIMGALGIALNAWINMCISPEIILGGLFSGLASTGCYEAFRNIIEKYKKNESDGE